MDTLRSLFPADDFSLVAVILGLPALGAFVNGVFGKRLGKEAVRLLALFAVCGSFLASLLSFAMLASDQGEGRPGAYTFSAWHWFDLSLANGHGSTPIEVAFLVDRLSSVMMLITTGVGALIHVYATAYMWSDPRADEDGGFHRFFAYMNLFVFAMLVLVMGKSLPVLFVGWEGVGLCSYLLIGFWFSDEQNAAAGKKAFLANRIGDFGLLVAMALLLNYTGSLDWKGIGLGAGALLERVTLWPIVGVPSAAGYAWTPTIATLVVLMLFLGCAGKSAQIPLYIWLPDAMAGPTPVSALIHAATMVTAGVYLACRLSGIFLLSPIAMAVIAFTGALTALLAASIGLVQTDIKKVLAYSTVSQLGFMFLGVGVGAFAASFFHVLTHAFFKACLFLGAGSVIHAMHAHIHNTDASQDIRNMGGLRKWMPLTFGSFFVSCIAIAGIPPFSGFFSKDEILHATVSHHIRAIAPPGEPRWEAGTSFGWLLLAMGLVAAAMTAFYMFRLLFLAFFSDFRGWNVTGGSLASDRPSGHGHGSNPLGLAHGDAPNPSGPAPHESPRAMTWVLVTLGVLATVGGFLNAGIFSHELAYLEHWLDPIFRGVDYVVRPIPYADSAGIARYLTTSWAIAIASVSVAAGGIAVAWWAYIAKGGEPARALAGKLPRLYALLRDKWRVDELYERTVIAAVNAIAEFAAVFDKAVVDGILVRVTALVVAALGTVLRAIQTGIVHAYSAVMVLGILALGWFFVWRPQARVTVDERPGGQYVIEAAPGLGYSYRWRTKSLEHPDTEGFGARRGVSVELEPGETKRILLEVRNAFERTGANTIVLTRPASGGPESKSTTGHDQDGVTP